MGERLSAVRPVTAVYVSQTQTVRSPGFGARKRGLHQQAGGLIKGSTYRSGMWSRRRGGSTAGSILLNLRGCQHRQCPTEAISGDNDVVAGRHGLAEDRFQFRPHGSGCLAITTCGTTRAIVSVEIGNSVREYQRVGTGESDKSRSASRGNKTMGAGFWQRRFSFLDDNAIFGERKSPGP
jgi:hypothetical protein